MKADVINGSIVNGIRSTTLFSFILDKPAKIQGILLNRKNTLQKNILKKFTKKMTITKKLTLKEKCWLLQYEWLRLELWNEFSKS